MILPLDCHSLRSPPARQYIVLQQRILPVPVSRGSRAPGNCSQACQSFLTRQHGSPKLQSKHLRTSKVKAAPPSGHTQGPAVKVSDEAYPPATEANKDAFASQWTRVIVIVAGVMLLASLQRQTTSVLAVPLAAEFHISLPQLGLLQSAALWATLWVSFLLASLRTTPSASAASAQWVPAEKRGRAMSILYGCFNAGSVLSMAATPFFATELGWPSAFRLFAIIGLVWAAVGWKVVPSRDYSKRTHHRIKVTKQACRRARQVQLVWKKCQITFCMQRKAHTVRQTPRSRLELQKLATDRLALLDAWCDRMGLLHLCTWIPTYLDYLGVTNLKTAGLLSALPWAATATAAVLAGLVADKLETGLGWTTVRVRRVMQSTATLGPALVLLPLILGKDHVSVTLAVACLTSTLALQAFCYAGFHAYLQDVANADAGKLLGLTNSSSTAVGIIGNLVTGQMAGIEHGYGIIFAITAALYFGSFITWNLFMKGAPVRL
ncbi:hypothetical protein WJX84_006573 [Apatococcus fuscideae]|uniref:Uncharacterized protein n=1 Tax=Apatococcus fuscideae TaxID=2026836 RepID=A0AAW1SDJ8_9CHLO